MLIKPGVRGSRKELETEFEKLTAAHDERTNELAESLRWIRSGKHVITSNQDINKSAAKSKQFATPRFRDGKFPIILMTLITLPGILQEGLRISDDNARPQSNTAGARRS